MLFPTPKMRLLEMTAPTRFTAKLEEPPVAGRPDVEPEGRAAADLQRLLHRRRRHRAARVRELRPPARLRGARAARRLGEGRDRDRALRPVVARHQAEGRGGARRHRLPDLLRSARRRVRGRRCVPEGPDAQRRRRAARQRRWTCRSIPAIRSRLASARRADAKRLDIKDAATLTKIPVLPISYGDAQPLLAALGGPLVPADWRGGLPLTYHIGPGPATVHLKVAFSWDIEAALQRHRPDPGLDVSRRVDRPRQPSRCVGERRRGSGQRHGARARGGARARARC